MIQRNKLKVEIDDIKTFLALFDAVGALVSTDLIMQFKSDHLLVNQINAMRTGLINLYLGKEFFDGYQANGEILAVDIEEFKKTLKMFKSFKRFMMESEETYKIHFLSTEGRKRKKVSLTLLDTTLEPIEIISENTTIIKLKSAEFKRAMKDCANIEDVVVIENTGAEFKVRAENDIRTKSNEDAWIVGEDIIALVSEPTLAAYPSEILKDIADKGEKLSKQVMIGFATNAPIKLTFDFKGGIVDYYVVPVIDPKYTPMEVST